MRPLLEICCASINSALAAQKGGADRIELCDNLFEGGTTPSFAMIKKVRELQDIKLHVLIRPRGGDFLYNDEEFTIILEDLKQCKKLDVDGVVSGFLTKNGQIDAGKTKRFVDMAFPLPVTFHRAFDMCRDPFEALKILKETGIIRLLTSGQKNKASEGVELIKELIKKADDEIIVIPGSGLDENNITNFAKETGAKEFHATLRSEIISKMNYRKNDVFMGGLAAIPEYDIKEADIDKVKRFVRELKNRN